MDIEAAVVKTVLKEETSFFDEAEVAAEGKIRDGVLDQQKTESGYGNPEQHPVEDFH